MSCILIESNFKAIVSACQKLYPEQQNPLQMSTLVKYWLGGGDPLDYITVYSNNQVIYLLSIYLSFIYLSNYLSIYLPIYLSIHASMYLGR